MLKSLINVFGFLNLLCCISQGIGENAEFMKPEAALLLNPRSCQSSQDCPNGSFCRFQMCFWSECMVRQGQEIDHTKPEKDHTHPEKDHTNPEKGSSKPEIDHTKPGIDNTKPDINHTKPEIDHTKPKTNGTKPKNNGTKLEEEDTKPEKETTKPEVHFTNPEKNDTKPEVMVTHEAGGSKKNVTVGESEKGRPILSPLPEIIHGSTRKQLGSTKASQSGSCPEGWIPYEPLKTCYKVMCKKTCQRYKASFRCKTKSAHLSEVDFSDQSHTDFIFHLVPKKSAGFLGARRTDGPQGTKWRWDSSGTTFSTGDVNPWAEGEPDAAKNPNQEFLVVRYSGEGDQSKPAIADVGKKATGYALCERPMV